MFSKAAEYAIRALIYLSLCHEQGKERVGLKEIAGEIDIPERFTANILQDLGRKGLIASVKGLGGGFYIPAPDELTLMEIVAAIDGTKQFQRCGLGIKNCDSLHPCPIHNQFVEVREKTLQMLRGTNLRELSDTLSTGEVFLKKD